MLDSLVDDRVIEEWIIVKIYGQPATTYLAWVTVVFIIVCFFLANEMVLLHTERV